MAEPLSKPLMSTAMADRVGRRLAICGGQPRFDIPRHFVTPTIPNTRYTTSVVVPRELESSLADSGSFSARRVVV